MNTLAPPSSVLNKRVGTLAWTGFLNLHNASLELEPGGQERTGLRERTVNNSCELDSLPKPHFSTTPTLRSCQRAHVSVRLMLSGAWLINGLSNQSRAGQNARGTSTTDRLAAMTSPQTRTDPSLLWRHISRCQNLDWSLVFFLHFKSVVSGTRGQKSG